MQSRWIRRCGWIFLVCVLLVGCGQRPEPEKIVLQRLSYYPGATGLTTTTTAAYVLVEFTTTDSPTAIRDHYRAKLPGFRFREPIYERLVDVYGDFDFVYVEGREAQVIVMDLEPTVGGQTVVKVYIHERTFR